MTVTELITALQALPPEIQRKQLDVETTSGTFSITGAKVWESKTRSGVHIILGE